MNIIFMGTPDFAAKTLEAIIKSRHNVKLVVSQPDKAKGRSKELVPTEVKAVALRENIPVFQPEKMKTQETFDELKKYGADIIVVAAYGRIIPKNILELPKYGCINLHASLLPKYRGAAPIQWAVLDGEEKTGVTVQQMNEGLDMGDIISVKECAIDKKETSESLFEKLAELGAELVVETLDKIENGEINPIPQPKISPTPYARMISKNDGRIDWNWDAAKIERWVRGMNSWPGAFAFAGKNNVKIWDCEIIDEDTDALPGTVTKADKNGLFVQTGKGQISITELQIQGKKRMAFDAFLRGCRWEAGMRFEEE